MDDTFLTFQKFNDPELAAIIASRLQEQGIATQIVNESQVFDVSFANNDFEQTVHLKLQPADFGRARSALEHYYEGELGSLPADYYLFSFTDEELIDLVQHPDEWGPLDYALAKQLLAKHGHTVTAEQEASIQHERLNELARPERSPTRWIIIGYLAAIVLSVLGLILGYILAYVKKTLPNGEQVYMYATGARVHGKRILVISVVFFVFWMWVLLAH